MIKKLEYRIEIGTSNVTGDTGIIVVIDKINEIIEVLNNPEKCPLNDKKN